MNKNELIRIGADTYKDETTGNLYKFSHAGKTPNGCWFIRPTFTRLLDICIATGEYVFGESYEYEIGEVQAY